MTNAPHITSGKGYRLGASPVHGANVVIFQGLRARFPDIFSTSCWRSSNRVQIHDRVCGEATYIHNGNGNSSSPPPPQHDPDAACRKEKKREKKETIFLYKPNLSTKQRGHVYIFLFCLFLSFCHPLRHTRLQLLSTFVKSMPYFFVSLSRLRSSYPAGLIPILYSLAMGGKKEKKIRHQKKKGIPRPSPISAIVCSIGSLNVDRSSAFRATMSSFGPSTQPISEPLV